MLERTEASGVNGFSQAVRPETSSILEAMGFKVLRLFWQGLFFF